jgi:hypothetical protein
LNKIIVNNVFPKARFLNSFIEFICLKNMKKICPRCGIIFEVTDDIVFCSRNCKSMFNQPNFPGFKATTSISERSSWGSHTEIIRSKPKEIHQPVQEKTLEEKNNELTEHKFSEKPKPLPEIKSKQSVHYEIIAAKKRSN